VSPDSKAWVLYDDSCGFCAWWVPRWEKTINRAGYHIAPLQSEWVAKALPMPAEQLVSDLRLIEKDGSSIAGANVYLRVMSKTWWTWPFSVILRIPGVNRIFWAGYRWFNRNRFNVSKACGLAKGKH
jgi:predicted DCC family thiol-disulfide oxidoreductase YuxK